MTLTKLHSNMNYASRAGEYYRQQRDKGNCKYHCRHEGCMRSYYSKAQLDAHMLGHSGEKPHKCDACGYESRQKYLLDRHREKAHGIPMPTTRISRSRMRHSAPSRFFCRRITAFTGLMPSERRGNTGLQRRVALYRQADNILDLLEPIEAITFISRKHFSSDKRRGYILDSYYIGEFETARHYQFGNSERRCEKLVDILNQLNTIRGIYPETTMKEEYERELELFKQDNNKAQKLIEQGIELLNTQFK